MLMLLMLLMRAFSERCRRFSRYAATPLSPAVIFTFTGAYFDAGVTMLMLIFAAAFRCHTLMLMPRQRGIILPPHYATRDAAGLLLLRLFIVYAPRYFESLFFADYFHAFENIVIA